MNAEQAQETQAALVERLQEVGVTVRPRGYVMGPTVTQYSLELGRGVSVRTLNARKADIDYRFGVTGRLGAPSEPERVTVEIPNDERDYVTLAQMLPALKDTDPLTLPVGMDMAGNLVTVDLGEAAHLLVGGQTGAGKSMVIRSMLSSFAMRKPSDVELLLIDPKHVEFHLFRSLPHLALPVVTESSEALDALEGALKTVQQRFRTMEAAGVVNIREYNARRAEGTPAMVPLVIVVDEVADLLMDAKEAVTNVLVRLAQLGRAAGVHMILATQRPSFDVFPTRLRTNIPARIGLKCAKPQDSRVLIDAPDCAHLLGKGDALFDDPHTLELQRVQTCYVETDDARRYVARWAGFADNLARVNKILANGEVLRAETLMAEGMTEHEVRDVFTYIRATMVTETVELKAS